ncbi:MAG: hypothetical protein JWO86_1372 [Myxococcaceae bacterium]|nr:hypothetical protein [Myxococcaceae bacterium]
MTSARRTFTRLCLPVVAAAIAAGSVQCGLLGAPGDYATGGATDVPSSDASVDTLVTTDGMVAQDTAVVLPDGNVVPASIGTITLMAGERQPTSPEDTPAWAADAWSGIIAADGHIATWRIDLSAPIVGSFDSAGLVGGAWVMINIGFGLSGGSGTAVQATSWSPGVAGDWKAARANGAPGGLDEYARVFAGNHLFYVGGVRTVADPDGGPPTSFFTREMHVATVDPAKPELGGATDPGQQLKDPRSRPGVLMVGGNLYVVGGRAPVAGGMTSSVELAKVDLGSGALQAFANQPALMNGGADHKVYLPGLAAVDGHLFVAGGRINGAGAPTDVVLSATIDADGTLGAWQAVTKLPKPLHDFAFVGFKGRLYVAGGVGAMARSDEVFSATVAADGTLGAWDTSNAKLPGARSDFVALAY